MYLLSLFSAGAPNTESVGSTWAAGSQPEIPPGASHHSFYSEQHVVQFSTMFQQLQLKKITFTLVAKISVCVWLAGFNLLSYRRRPVQGWEIELLGVVFGPHEHMGSKRIGRFLVFLTTYLLSLSRASLWFQALLLWTYPFKYQCFLMFENVFEGGRCVIGSHWVFHYWLNRRQDWLLTAFSALKMGKVWTPL